MANSKFGLFEVYGIELEYMCVDPKTLNVLPVVDQILKKAHGSITTDHVEQNMGWANELVLHVIEVRTDDPVRSFEGLDKQFSNSLAKLEKLAGECGGMLLPTAMHPWMDPAAETKLWPHEYHEVYEQFDRIFNCRRHGWANLQSCQINLPFSGDEEFRKLHAAVRVILPILPAIAASSPFVLGKVTDHLDNRLLAYRTNAEKVPMVAGRCIPEPVFSKGDYEKEILEKIYDSILPLDPEEVLKGEWLNARGAIPRFDRNAIEIRILDMQEFPGADIAISRAVADVTKLLATECFVSIDVLEKFNGAVLEGILGRTIQFADETVIEEKAYLELFGVRESSCSAKDLWAHLSNQIFKDQPARNTESARFQTILREGVLARRLRRAGGADPSRQRLEDIYRELALCLKENRFFHA